MLWKLYLNKAVKEMREMDWIILDVLSTFKRVCALAFNYAHILIQKCDDKPLLLLYKMG